MKQMDQHEVILYIAMSLDGYIARENGDIAWLHEVDNPEGSDFGYSEFIKRIDTLLMGRKTYDIVTGFDLPWPYDDKKCYVVSRTPDLEINTPDTQVISGLDQKAVSRLKQDSRKNIWLMGGGDLVTHCLTRGLIDECIICIIPRILGKGIPLFPGNPPDTLMELQDCTTYTGGAVILTYRPKVL